MLITRSIKSSYAFILGTSLLIIVWFMMYNESINKVIGILLISWGLMISLFGIVGVWVNNSKIKLASKYYKLLKLDDIQWEIKCCHGLRAYKLICVTPYGSFKTKSTDLRVLSHKINIYKHETKNKFVVEILY